MWETKQHNILQTGYDQTRKSLFLDHYFKSICKTTLLWTKFALVQSSSICSETLRNFENRVIPNYSIYIHIMHAIILGLFSILSREDK